MRACVALVGGCDARARVEAGIPRCRDRCEISKLLLARVADWCLRMRD